MENLNTAVALWRHTLAQIPTLCGRLIYLTSLRDANSGRYKHAGLSQRFGEIKCAVLLEESHQQCFSLWLDLTLAQQKDDLEQYLDAVQEEPRLVIGHWLSHPPFSLWIPPGARTVEQQLFLSDLQTIMELLRVEFRVEPPDPEA